MAKRADITPELCRQLLHYVPSTGALLWKERPAEMFTPSRDRWGGVYSPEARAKAWNARYAGQPAFTATNSSGYFHGQILGVCMAAHQVAWIIQHGSPDGRFIDHIDGNRSDNRVANLRLVTPLQNSTNQKVNRRNTSGHKGVRWSAEKGKWQASINHDRRFRHLGYFERIEDAAAAYKQAAAKFHGCFARAQ